MFHRLRPSRAAALFLVRLLLLDLRSVVVGRSGNKIDGNCVLACMNDGFGSRLVKMSRMSRRSFASAVGSLTAAMATAQMRSAAEPENLESIFSIPRASWNAWIAALEKRIPELMKQTSVPGLSLVLIRDGKIYWRRGFGVRDAETQQPVDDRTVFEAASMSKAVFAYVVLKLAERGVLDLDAPLTKYTPARYVQDDPGRLELITARHVLTHATGFPNWRSQRNPMRINFRPGQKHSYSGEGYSYLQSVVTRLTGHEDGNHCQTFEEGARFCATDIADYMQQHLLRPFGMNSSTYLWNEQIARNLARPHGRQGEPLPFRKPGSIQASRYAAAGGLITTPTDYAKFLIEVIQPRPAGAHRLSTQSRDEMVRPQIAVGDFNGYSVFWGLGWRIVKTVQYELVGHGGSNPGFQCFSSVSLAQKAGFVIMTNSDSGGNLLQRLTATLIGS
ncbi:MAG: beta-lactamase family protein [Acidobacteria bacterium]|nr:beta-lactamase family protein [Acidobacteriota bacterium]